MDDGTTITMALGFNEISGPEPAGQVSLPGGRVAAALEAIAAG